MALNVIPELPGSGARLNPVINTILWLITSSVDESFNDTSHQNMSALDGWMDGGNGKEERDQPSRASEEPSAAPSHPIRSNRGNSEPRRAALCSPPLNNNQRLTTPPPLVQPSNSPVTPSD